MRQIHPGTTVEIDPNTYNDFRVLSIVDCNVVFEKSITELVQKHDRGQLRFKADMPMNVIERLRAAVIESVVVEDYIRDKFI